MLQLKHVCRDGVSLPCVAQFNMHLPTRLRGVYPAQIELAGVGTSFGPEGGDGVALWKRFGCRYDLELPEVHAGSAHFQCRGSLRDARRDNANSDPAVGSA